MPAIAGRNCIVAGTGYTGARLLTALAGCVGVNRHRPPAVSATNFFVRDLDQDYVAPVILDERSTMIYSIPPAPVAAGVTRLGRILRALQPALLRVVYFSTTGVYGDRQGRLTDERSPASPVNARAKRRLADEKLLLEYCSRHQCEAVILRVPGIYGPGRLGIKRIQSGTPCINEEDAYPGNRIHVDDLVRCAIAALQPETPAGVYNVGDGDHRSSVAFATKVAELAGLQTPTTISRVEAIETFPDLRLSFLREARTLDTAKMRDVLRVVPRYSDPADGIKASLLDDGLLAG